MRIAVLYICTGRYTIFWDAFFRSCEACFLSAHERHYFVFTDGDIAQTGNERVHRIEQKNLGWPGNTLYRYRMFHNIREQLAAFDYIFFFNANCEFTAPVGEEFLPSEEEGITVVRHPGFYDQEPDAVTYDRNPKSRACISFGQGAYYVCGGVNGGHRQAYLALVNALREAIDEDDARGVVALWHDESHINKYILTHPHKLLSPAYCYSEGKNIPFEKIIFLHDKAKYGGYDFLRGIRYPAVKSACLTALSMLRRLLRRLWRIFREMQ